ncbi:MAG: hypothetical protein ACRD1Z_06625 [Vicinamibacteria bacterium]
MIPPADSGGIQIPVGWVAAVVGGMAVAIVTLFKWALRLLRENKELQRELLNEKEEKVRILQGLKQRAEEKKRGSP